MSDLSRKASLVFYNIAELGCEISFPKEVFIDKILTSARPFRCNIDKINNFACRITVIEDSFKEDMSEFRLLTEVKDILGECSHLYESFTKYLTVITLEGEKYSMISSKDFSYSEIYVNTEDKYANEILTSFFMVAFSQTAVLHNTILIHASVVEKDGFGYAFLGKSGTGKSTHSSLWLKNIENVRLLNDDNPAVRVDSEGQVFIYGTPWSGKTPCYVNRKVSLKAAVRLQQAPENIFMKVNDMNAFVVLLPSCSSLRWNDLMYSRLCDILEKIICQIQVCTLLCLPNKDAAELCYDSLNNKN